MTSNNIWCWYDYNDDDKYNVDKDDDHTEDADDSVIDGVIDGGNDEEW